jgi:protein-tyrosine phosphatase
MNYILGSYNIFKTKIFTTDYSTPVERIEPSVPWYHQYMHFYSPSNEITDDLFLGSSFNAYNLDELKQNKINVIINVSNDIDNFYPEHFIYYKFNIADNNSDDINNILEESYNIITKNLEMGNKILVHCYMGASRSATVIIYYLMRKYSIPYKIAKNIVIQKRPIINLSMKFHNTLENLSFIN